MSFSKAVSLCTFVIVGGFSPAFSKEFDLPGGLLFGATFSEVQVMAQSQGWDLEQATFSSDAWSVGTMGLTFYFCDQSLTSFDQSLDGDSRTFVETVLELRTKYGEPDTDVFILSPRSRFEKHGVQTAFETDKGVRLSVQISTKDNVQTVWTRASDSSVCEKN